MSFPIQYMMVWSCSITGMCSIYFIGGTCLMLISMTKDLKRELQSINKMAITKKNRSKIFKEVNKFIKLHSNVKQFSKFDGNIFTKNEYIIKYFQNR